MSLVSQINAFVTAVGADYKALRRAESQVPSYGLAVNGSVPAHRYDKTRGIYNYESANTRRLEQGLSRAQLATGGMSRHLIIGDSVSAGSISAVGLIALDRLRAWPLSMRDALGNTGTPGNGTGIIRHVDGASPNPFDTRWAYAGTWAGATSCTQSTTVNSTATLTPDRSGTVFDYWYYDSTGGTFTISVDGAVAGAGFATVVANGSAGWKRKRLYGVTINGSEGGKTPSSIVVKLTVVGTSGLIAAGGDVWSPNAGLTIENAAQSGASASGTGAAAWSDIASGTSLGLVFNDVGGRRRTLSDVSVTAGSPNMNSTTGAFTDSDLGQSVDELNIGAGGRMFPDNCFIGARNSATQVVIYQGIGAAAVPVNAYSNLSSQSVAVGRDPDCVHIALGLNDMSGLAASDATITAAITTIRNRFPNSDCMLHLTQEYATSYVSAARQLTFQAAMYALADTLDVPLYDWRDRVGTFVNGQNNGVYGDQAVHLTSATEADLGSQLATIMGMGAGRPQTAYAPVLDADITNKAYVDKKLTGIKGSALAVATSPAALTDKLFGLQGGVNKQFAVSDIRRYLSVEMIMDAGNVAITPAAVSSAIGVELLATSKATRNKLDLSQFTQARLVATVIATGNVATAAYKLSYATAENTTWASGTGVADAIGAAPLVVGANGGGAGVIHDSGWVNLAAGAKIDNCYIALLVGVALGTTAPTVGSITAYFR